MKVSLFLFPYSLDSSQAPALMGVGGLGGLQMSLVGGGGGLQQSSLLGGNTQSTGLTLGGGWWSTGLAYCTTLFHTTCIEIWPILYFMAILLVKHDSKNSSLILSPVMNCLRRNPGTRATEHDTTGLLNLQCEAIWQMTRYCSWSLVSMPWPLPVFDCFFSIQIWRALGDLIMCDNVM